MKGRLAFAVAVLALVSAQFRVAEAADDRYVFSAHILFAFSPVEADADGEGSVVHQIGTRTIQVKGGEILWDGTTRWPEDDPDLKLLSSPRIPVRVGQDFAIRSGWTQPMQYFEPDGDCFVLNVVDPSVEPGIRLDGKITNPVDLEDGTKAIDLDFSVHVTVFGPREPIPGVSLDVGAPTIHSTESKGRLRLVIGEWVFLMISQAPVHGQDTSDSVILLARVDEATPN